MPRYTNCTKRMDHRFARGRDLPADGAGGRGRPARRPACIDAIWDSQRYIRVDEIKPGMPAYCLTDYGEAGIEKFELKVLDVVEGFGTWSRAAAPSW